MRTRCINASPHEAEALHKGRATAIVRPMKPQPHPSCSEGGCGWHWHWTNEDYLYMFFSDKDDIGKSPLVLDRCHHGRVGDVLEFRETWAAIPSMKPSGYFTNPKWVDRTAWYEVDNDRPTWGGPWRSSATMPRKHIRTRRVIASIDAIRVANTTEERAEAVGARDWLNSLAGRAYDNAERAACRFTKIIDPNAGVVSKRGVFAAYYESRHGEGSWAAHHAWFIGLERMED